MLKKRILSFLGALAITAALTFAVVEFSPAGSFTTGTMQEGVCYEVAGISPDAIVARLGDNGASADLVAYWIGYSASYLESFMQYYGATLDWDVTLSDGASVRDYVKQDSLDAVREQLMVESLAEKYGAGLSDEQAAAMAETEAGYIEQYGSEEAYVAEIAKLGITRETYDRVMRLSYLYANLYSLYLTEGSPLYVPNSELASVAAEQGYISADHILLATVDLSTGKALSDEEIAAQREKAETLLADLAAYTGDDLTAYFASLADENSEDGGRASHPAGYTFTTGEMVEAFETAAYALSEGSISEIVESPYGYHIILRLPLDEAAAADTVRGDYFASAIANAGTTLELETSGECDKLDPQLIYEAIKAAQAGE